MKKMRTRLLLVAFNLPVYIYGQDASIHGKVVSQKSREPLIGVNIIIDDSSGTVTDFDGNYRYNVSPGNHKVEYRFIGFKSQVFQVTVKNGEDMVKNVELSERITELDIVVVSAGKFEQKIEEVTVSMEVIKPQLVTAKNTYNLENLMDQIPGVSVIDQQCNIRGGSGYSYGAGSRVLVLVDDIPMLASDANDVKWNFLPVENLEQIEVIKGASSALYGSSALNGIINIRTAYPKDVTETPGGKKSGSETVINLFRGIYWDPVRRDSITGTYRDTTGKLYKPLKWWPSPSQWYEIPNPVYTGMNFMHSTKIDNVDLVLGGNIFSDQGFRQGEFEQWVKTFLNTRYRFKNIEGLTAGINGTFMKNNGGWFFFWEDADSGAYKPRVDSGTATISTFTTSRTNIDPYIVYITKRAGKHSLKNRYFNTTNINNTSQGAHADNYYSEYQFQKEFGRTMTLTAGLVGSYTEVVSQLYGDHYGFNYANYAQAEKKFNRLSLSLGFRGEYYRVDTAETTSSYDWKTKSDTFRLPVQPVFRSGINYRVAEETYLRTSFGQGYRFPSIAEKYIRTNVSAINVFPNPSLQPEHGWSAEVGAKQGFKVANWKGYADIAGFWTEYLNMIEFSFGTYYPGWINADSMVNAPGAYLFSHGVPIAQIGNAFLDTLLKYAGFKAENIGKSQIKGIELSVGGSGTFNGLSVFVLGGYTYLDPVNFNKDPEYLKTLSDSAAGILKYRSRHMAKGDIQTSYKKFTFGISIRYNSFMENVDKAFEDPLMIKGVEEYRNKNNTGTTVCDARFSYQITSSSRISLLSNNIFNKEYMGRPGDMQAPRTVALQYSMRF